jgi:hypothetical protein
MSFSRRVFHLDLWPLARSEASSPTRRDNRSLPACPGQEQTTLRSSPPFSYLKQPSTISTSTYRREVGQTNCLVMTGTVRWWVLVIAS